MRKVQVIFLLHLLFPTLYAALGRASFKPLDKRVKQHRHKSGELVEGEETLLKLILSWKSISGAEFYEVCHNCVDLIDQATGEEIGSTTVKVLKSIGTYGGNPSVVMPAIPSGLNSFHLRFTDESETSKWSEVVHLDVSEVGQAEIVEVEVDKKDEL